MKRYTDDEVIKWIFEEREYQDNKFGKNKEQNLAGWILILQAEIKEAHDGWIKDCKGRNAPLHEILQIATVAFRCLEQYGKEGNTFSTDEEPSIPPREYIANEVDPYNGVLEKYKIVDESGSCTVELDYPIIQR